MSLSKIIVTLLATGFVLFVLMLWYALKDKISNVSDESPYNSFINRPLVLEREMLLFKNKPALSKFTVNFLAETNQQQPAEIELLYRLPKGTNLTISKFSSVKNGTSGFTSWYATGKIYIETIKADVDFEYDWPRDYSFMDKLYKEHSAAPWSIGK